MDIMAGLHEGSKQHVFMGATVAMTPLCAHHPLHLARLYRIEQKLANSTKANGGLSKKVCKLQALK